MLVGEVPERSRRAEPSCNGGAVGERSRTMSKGRPF